jgi:FAD/FMN-containing dehydrogenase
MTSAQAIAAELAHAVSCRVVSPQDSDYEVLRSGFNSMIDLQPSAIVRVRSDDDVVAALRVARARDIPLAIRAGGHSAPGFFACDGGIVIDVRQLDQISVDPSSRTVTCGTGLTWRQFDAATQEYGLAVTGGRVSSTGVTGLTIGSGSGWLERAMGLTSDNLIGARMITAAGSIVDTDDDADLLWALRGGGGNFGVLTDLRFALRPLGPTVWAGVRMYPYERAAEVLGAYREVMSQADPRLCGGFVLMTVHPGVVDAPAALQGKPVVAVVVLWAGDLSEGERGVAPLDALGPAALDRVGPVSYADFQRAQDGDSPFGHRDYFKGGFVKSLGEGALDAIVALGRDMQAPYTQILCAPLGRDTAYGEADEQHSTIGNRDEGWSFQVLSLWADADDDQEQKAWTRAAADTLSAYSSLVSYPNFLPSDEIGNVEAAFSPSVLRRLRLVKDRYDPENLFRINNNIKPSAVGAGR